MLPVVEKSALDLVPVLVVGLDKVCEAAETFVADWSMRGRGHDDETENS